MSKGESGKRAGSWSDFTLNQTKAIGRLESQRDTNQICVLKGSVWHLFKENEARGKIVV